MRAVGCGALDVADAVLDVLDGAGAAVDELWDVVGPESAGAVDLLASHAAVTLDLRAVGCLLRAGLSCDAQAAVNHPRFRPSSSSAAAAVDHAELTRMLRGLPRPLPFAALEIIRGLVDRAARPLAEHLAIELSGLGDVPLAVEAVAAAAEVADSAESARRVLARMIERAISGWSPAVVDVVVSADADGELVLASAHAVLAARSGCLAMVQHVVGVVGLQRLDRVLSTAVARGFADIVAWALALMEPPPQPEKTHALLASACWRRDADVIAALLEGAEVRIGLASLRDAAAHAGAFAVLSRDPRAARVLGPLYPFACSGSDADRELVRHAVHVWSTSDLVMGGVDDDDDDDEEEDDVGEVLAGMLQRLPPSKAEIVLLAAANRRYGDLMRVAGRALTGVVAMFERTDANAQTLAWVRAAMGPQPRA